MILLASSEIDGVVIVEDGDEKIVKTNHKMPKEP